jgi:hypothetical protein
MLQSLYRLARTTTTGAGVGQSMAHLCLVLQLARHVSGLLLQPGLGEVAIDACYRPVE